MLARNAKFPSKYRWDIRQRRLELRGFRLVGTTDGDRRSALELLADLEPHCVTFELANTHGIAIETLISLAAEGLGTIRVERSVADGKPVERKLVKITPTGLAHLGQV